METPELDEKTIRATVVAHSIRLGKTLQTGMEVDFDFQLVSVERVEDYDPAKVAPSGNRAAFIVTAEDIEAGKRLINDQQAVYKEPKLTTVKLRTRLSTPLPKRMRALQRDSRGYPVPFVVMRDTDGRPHFTINDTEKVLRCITERRCGICGNRIAGVCWFVGGPLSAFSEDGAYMDVALHDDCMRYSMQVCPYLAVRNYSGRIDTGSLDPAKIPGDTTALKDYTMIPERPTVFVAVAVMRYRSAFNANYPDAPSLKPERPYAAVEFWQHGRQLDQETGMGLVTEAMKRLSL